MIWLLFIYVIAAFAEMAGVLAITLVVTSYFNDLSIKILGQEVSFSILETSFFLMLVFLARFLIIVYSQKNTINFCLMVGSYIKLKILKSFFYRDYQSVSKESLPKQIQILTEVTNSFSNTFLHTLLKLITDLIIVFVFVTYIALKEPYVVLFIITCGILLFVVYKFLFAHKFKEYGIISNRAAATTISLISESVNGIKEIKVGNNEKRFLDLLKSSTEKYARSQTTAKQTMAYIKVGLETLIFLILVFLLLSYVDIEKDLKIQISTLVPFLYVVLRLMPLCNQLIYSASNLKLQQNSVDLIFEQLKIHQSYEPYQLVKSEKFEIELKNVSYFFDEDKPIITNFSYTFRPGKIYAICGPTGSGKTTLLNIIAGLLKPKKGSINYKSPHANQDKKGFISYMGQLPFMINATIDENIKLGETTRNISLEEVKELSMLTEFLSLSNRKLSVNEVSGGQRQRVGIARTLFADKEFILMDEPSSALDNDTAKNFFANLKILSKNKCVILISHDTDLCNEYADKIIWLASNSSSR
ncbi:ABC transporter ATP-binding protein [Alphaproteobacteria bacterium]|nr:ABC transporter ATP-binding protein [Alphaproteobacteria bacterium]